MAVLAYIESNKLNRKNTFEIISYARGLADQLTELIVLSFNIDDTTQLSNRSDKILNINDNKLSDFNIQKYADIIAQACKSLSIDTIVIGGSADSKYLAPSLSVKTNSSYVSNVVELPSI